MSPIETPMSGETSTESDNVQLHIRLNPIALPAFILCREIPPAVPANYNPKGSYETHAGFSCYVTGPRDAKKAIFFLYDVFGFQSPTLQGADILASADYLVVIPDMFEGKPVEMEWFARDTEEKRENVDKFMARIKDPQPHIENVHTVLNALKQAFPHVHSWGAIGYCWGGKIVAITSGEGTPWTVGVQTSPAQVDPEDAKKAIIPMALLASKDEPQDAVQGFGEAIKTAKHIEVFHNQVHGFMSARADLSDPQVKQEYERGYRVALDFIATHI